MKLDCLTIAGGDQSIVRLSEFSANEASILSGEISKLSEQREREVKVHKLAGVSSVAGCELIFHLSARDQGILTAGPSRFECRLTAGTWDNVAGLVEPLTKDVTGYQWLVGSTENGGLLISANGDW